MGLSQDDLRALDVFSGNALWQGMRPRASVYSGHQFGVWAGQLGDGRALWLGEIDAPGLDCEFVGLAVPVEGPWALDRCDGERFLVLLSKEPFPYPTVSRSIKQLDGAGSERDDRNHLHHLLDFDAFQVLSG